MKEAKQQTNYNAVINGNTLITIFNNNNIDNQEIKSTDYK